MSDKTELRLTCTHPDTPDGYVHVEYMGDGTVFIETRSYNLDGGHSDTGVWINLKQAEQLMTFLDGVIG